MLFRSKVEGANPVRVALDPRGTLDSQRAMFTDGAAPTLWMKGTMDADPSSTSADVEVIHLPSASGAFDPTEVVAELRARGLHRILIEGGGVTVSRFLEAGVLDRLHVSVAPLVIGSGRPGIMLPEIQTLDEARRPPVRHFRLGSDVLFDLDLRSEEA